MATGITSNKNFGIISNTLDTLNYTPIQKAGIISRFNAESSLSPKAVNPNDGGKGKNSVGLGQWNNERADGLLAFAKKNGNADPNDVATQVKYFDYDLKNNEPTAYAAMKSARTPADASAAMMHYERPAGYKSNNVTGVPSWGKTVQGAEDIAGHFGVWSGGDNTGSYGVGKLTSLTDGPKGQETVTTSQAPSGGDPVTQLFSQLDAIGGGTGATTTGTSKGGVEGFLNKLGANALTNAAEKPEQHKVVTAPKIDMQMPSINFSGLI